MEKVYFVKMLTSNGTFEEIIWSDTQAGAKYRRHHPEKDGYSLKELRRRCSFGEKYIDPNNLTEKEKDLYEKMLKASNRRKRKNCTYVEEVKNTEDEALETSGDFNVYFMSKLPDPENVIGNTIYCVPIDPNLDIIKYQEDHKEALPDESVFKLYIPIETSMGREFVRITWDPNIETYVGIPDDEGPENEEPPEDTTDTVNNTTNYILEALPGHLKARINKIFEENSTIYLYILTKINKIEDLCNNIIRGGGSSVSAEDNYYLIFGLIFELAKMDCFDADSISSLKTILKDIGYSYIDELVNNL